MYKLAWWLLGLGAVLSWHSSWAEGTGRPAAPIDSRKSSIDVLGDIWCWSDEEFDEILEKHFAAPARQVPAVRVFIVDMWTYYIPRCGEGQGMFPCAEDFPYDHDSRGFDVSKLSDEFSERFRGRITRLLDCGIRPIICLREYGALLKTTCPNFGDHPYNKLNNWQGWGGLKPEASIADTEHFGRRLIDMLVRALDPPARNKVIWEIGNQPPVWALEAESRILDSLYAYYQDEDNKQELQLTTLTKSRVWMTIFSYNQASRFLELNLNNRVGVVSVHNIGTVSDWIEQRQTVLAARGNGRRWNTPLIPNTDGTRGFWAIDLGEEPWCMPVKDDSWKKNLEDLSGIVRREGYYGVLWDPCLYRKHKTLYLHRLDEVIERLK